MPARHQLRFQASQAGTHYFSSKITLTIHKDIYIRMPGYIQRKKGSILMSPAFSDISQFIFIPNTTVFY